MNRLWLVWLWKKQYVSTNACHTQVEVQTIQSLNLLNQNERKFTIIQSKASLHCVLTTLNCGSIISCLSNNLKLIKSFASRESLDKTPIFHVTSSTYKPFRWAMVEDKMSVLLQKYPLKQAVWYPYLKLVPSLSLYYISAFIFHLIPAYFFDTLAKFTGQRPK